jgi:hypothetical protein
MKRLHAVLVVGALLTGALPCAAQNLYSYRGAEIERVTGGAGTSDSLLGMDDHGWLYHGGKVYDAWIPLSCYRGDDPEGTLTQVHVGAKHYVAYSAMMHDHSGVFLVGISPGISMGLLRCGDGSPDGYTWDAVEYAGAAPNLPDTYGVATKATTLVMSPDGEPCFVTDEGLLCGAVDDDAGTVSFALRVDLSEMDSLLAPDPGLGKDVVDVWRGMETTRRWRLRTTYWTPGGRHFSIIDVRFEGFDWEGKKDITRWFGYLVEHLEDGSLGILLRPPRPAKPGLVWEGGDEYSGQADPLYDATSLVYSPQLDALLAWPLEFWDWDSTYVSNPGSGYSGPAGPDGVGFYAIPFAEDYAAYLSLIDDLIHVSPYAAFGVGDAVTLPDGEIGLVLRYAPDGLLYRVVFDLDALDIDTDGLTYNQELELGTTDYWPQSDWSTTADPIEALITGTDPTDIGDDPAPAVSGRFAYVRSGLIRKYLGELGLLEDVMSHQISGASIDAPLCLQRGAEIECILEDRSSRLRFTPETGDLFGGPIQTGMAFSQDGDHVAYLAPSGIRRVFFPDGREELVIDAAALAAVAPDHADALRSLRISPVDEDLLFISFGWDGSTPKWGIEEFFVYAILDGEAPRLVYDHQQARCDSEMGPCDPQFGDGTEGFPTGGYSGTPKKPNDFLWGVRVAGWFPEIDRLLLVVAAKWSRYYVALHHEAPPTRLMGAKYFQGWYQLLGMPEFVMPTGHGEYFVGSGFLNGWLANPYRFEADGLTGSQPPGSFWGDIMVGLEYFPSRLWEYVRYDGWGEPGDVIFLDTFLHNDGLGWYHMMARSGPRGGMAQAWRRGEFFNNPWGMDVREDGLLCLVDRGDRGGKSYGESVVHIMEPSVPNRIPDTFLMTIEGFPDATDCHFTGDNSVDILVPEPPLRIRYEMWSGEWEIVEEYPEGSVPIDLIEGPDGDAEALYEDGDLRGFLYLKDGRRLEMDKESFVVTVDGQPVADLNRLIWADPSNPMSPTAQTFARFVERPDGLVVAVPFGCTLPAPIGAQLLAFDPNTPLDIAESPGFWPLTAYDNLYPHEGSPLAVMPGGDYTHPWGPPRVQGPEGSQPEIPGPHPAPAAGALVPQEETAGCSAAPTGDRAVVSLLLLLLCALALVPRRSTPTSHRSR